MPILNIEKFFLTTLLKITIVGVSLILASNIWFSPENQLAIIISAAIFSTAVIAYLLKNKHPNFAIIIVSFVTLITVSYQRYMIPNSSTSLAIALIIGFIYSVLLKGKVMWIMHTVVLLLINTVFIMHGEDIIRAGITYSILYFIITYVAGVLKCNYDKIYQFLRDSNVELNEKSKEIEAQNEELLQIQDNLNRVNNDLEKMVLERTRKITEQKNILLRYSYNNAHHLRGPVARLLGLASVYKLESNPQPDFYIGKMAEEAIEIDLVVKRINEELEFDPIEPISHRQS